MTVFRPLRPASRTRIFVLLLTLLAFGLRLWRLDSVPPGWRDDELINSLVISQKVLDGELAVYYADASGHEALYHALNAVMLGLFGPGAPGIRWLSAFLGTLTVPLTYLVGRRLYGRSAGLVAAAGLTVSFWSLMYSRVGLRHILMPVLTLAAFYFFWQIVKVRDSRLKIKGKAALIFNHYSFASLFTGLGFYTYFAGRGAPLILLAFVMYWALVDGERVWRKRWQLAAMFGLTAVLALPLIITLGRQPESEARVAELAVPLVAAGDGDFEPLVRHVAVTLSMFHSDGDDEWLYNIPHRPVFGPMGAAFFWMGVLIALGYALAPLLVRFRFYVLQQGKRPSPASAPSLASAFLLFWWLAGIAPAFISVPPASLGHTILAQPAVYLLAAAPVWQVGKIKDLRLKSSRSQSLIFNLLPVLLGSVFVVAVAARDFPDYFVNWPGRGMVRFLYRADIHEVADYLNEHPELTDFGITGLLAGPWDRLALQIDMDEGRKTAVSPRWYNPERALLLEPEVSFAGYPEVAAAYAEAYTRVPETPGIGGYRLNRVDRMLTEMEPVCFAIGLCNVWRQYNPATGVLELGWRVERPLDLPPISLISNPPPPGVYSGPRLLVFAQLLDGDGNFLTGDDGLWVDPQTLQPGDLFIQQHRLLPAEGEGTGTAVFGLYDPLTGERILTTGGQDHVRLPSGE